MNEVSATRNIDQIAVEINVIKEQARNTLLQASVEIGRRLVEAKVMIGHGNWKNWLIENVEYSERTAQNLMSIYHEYGLKPASEAMQSLPYTKALELLKLPGAEREEFVEANNVEDMSTRELEAVIKELNEERKKNADLQLDISELTKTGNDIASRLETAEMACRASTEKVKDAIKLEKELKQQKNAAQKSAEEVARLERELAEVKGTTPEPVTVEVIPPDISVELSQLRDLAKRAPNEEIIKFRTLYGEFERVIGELSNTLTAMAPEDQDKYKGALRAACRRISDSL